MSTAPTTLFLNPTIAHRLGVVLQFVDAFTRVPIRTPMLVSIPAERWDAVRSEEDQTYRFVLSNRDIPAGIFDVEVECPSQEYESREAVVVTLPLVIGHPPPVLRGDFLVQFPLWPTRRFQADPGETAVIGRLLHTGPPLTPAVDMRVRMFAPAVPPPGTPYAYTNANGEFVYRLPGLRMSMSGGTAITTAAMNIEVRDAADALVFAPTPSSSIVRLGERNDLTIEIT